MVRCRRSAVEAVARVVMARSWPTGEKVGATGGAPSSPASSSMLLPVAVTSHARSTYEHHVTSTSTNIVKTKTERP